MSHTPNALRSVESIALCADDYRDLLPIRPKFMHMDCMRSVSRYLAAIFLSLGCLLNLAKSAPAFVQAKDVRAFSGKTATVTFSANSTQGNLIVAYVIWDNTGTVSISDTAGNSYVSAVGPTRWHSNRYSVQIFYAKNIAAGSTRVTATFGTTLTAFGSIYITEYSGLDRVAPLDATAAGTGSSASMSSGSASTTTSSGLLFGAGVSDGSVTNPGTGFTARATSYGDLTMDRIVTAAGSYSATARSSSGAWAMQMVAFKGASTTDTTAPTVPTGLAASAASSNQINLTWTASTDNVAVTGYRIYRNGVAVGTSSTTSYSDTGLSSGVSYSYTVAAYDAAGNTSSQSSAASATTPDTVAPSVPAGLSAVAVSSTQINLTWTASTDNVGVAGYRITRNGSIVGTSTGAAYSDAGLVSGSSYTYAVAAYDAAGNISANSSSASATTPDVVAPTAPTVLSAVAVSSTQITLSWNASTDNVGVTGYRIYRNGSPVGNSSSTSYTDSGLISATTYTYTVAALDAAGNVSPLSNSAAATTPDGVAPTIPAGLSATAASATQVNLAWSASTDNVGVAGYRITRNGAVIGTSAVPSYSDSGLVSGATYSYAVSAYDAAGNSSALSSPASVTTPDNVAPTMPTGLVATATSSTQVSLSWIASTDNVGVTGYRIYRNGSAVGTSFTTSYADTGLISATTYTYTVAALDAAGNVSSPSSSASATTPDGVAPTVPAGLSATAASATQVNLTWSPSTDNVGVTGYRISRNGAVVGTSPIPSYSDTGLVSGATYSYAVAAYDADGNASAFSSPTTVTTPDNVAPTVPTGLVATATSSTQVALTWTASTDNVGVTGYRIYRDGSLIGTAPSATYTDSGLSASTTYVYAVAAYDAAGNVSATSSSTSATTNGLQLPVITSFSATPTSIIAGQSTTLAWATTNATTLSIDRGIGAVTGTTSKVVSPAASVVYTLTATNSFGSTTAQASVTVTADTLAPTVPTNINPTAISPSEIVIGWSPSTDNVGVVQYSIYRNGSLIGTSTSTSYTDGGLTANTTYTYSVAASDLAGNTSATSAGEAETTLAALGGTYTTTFPLNETPIFENGVWLNGKTDGLDWADVRTSGGLAFGTESGSDGFDDSTAILTGTWGPDQTVQATVHSVNQNESVFEEVELRLRSRLSAHVNSGYEVNFRCSTGPGRYVQIVRWNGPLGDFSFVDSTAGPGINDGDVVKASIIGNVISVYINDVLILQRTDSTFTSGNPGLGFYQEDGTASINQDYGFTRFSATDGSAADTTAPTVPTNLTATAISGTQVNLAWTASTDAFGVAGYQIFRNGSAIGVTTTASYSDTNLTAGASYTYTVLAFDVAGNSSAQSVAASATTPSVDTTPPTVPSNLQLVSKSSSAASFSWTASTDNVAVAGYRVFRNGTQIATTTTTDFTDSGLTASTTYLYTVAAYDAAANASAQSNSLSVTTSAVSTTPPVHVQAANNQISSGASTSVAFGSSTTTGNTIVVFVIWSNTSTVTVSDTRGNTYVAVGTPIAWTSSYRAQVFYATNITGGTNTITARYQTSVSSFGVVYANEYRGVNTANPVDVIKSATGASATLSSGSFTTTSPNDMIYCACVSDNTVTAGSSGFTIRSTAYGNLTEDRVGTTAGAYTVTASHNGSAWGLQVLALRPAN